MEDRLHALIELKKLLDAGIINEAEFAEQKKKILSNNVQPGEENPTFVGRGRENTGGTTSKKLLWIIIGIVVVIAILAFAILSNNSREKSSFYGEDSSQDEVPATKEFEEATSVEEAVPYYGDGGVCPYDGIPDDEIEKYNGNVERTYPYESNSNANAWE